MTIMDASQHALILSQGDVDLEEFTVALAEERC